MFFAADTRYAVQPICAFRCGGASGDDRRVQPEPGHHRELVGVQPVAVHLDQVDPPVAAVQDPLQRVVQVERDVRGSGPAGCPVPAGITPTGIPVQASAAQTTRTVPSPPATRTRSDSCSIARLAIALPGVVLPRLQPQRIVEPADGERPGHLAPERDAVADLDRVDDHRGPRRDRVLVPCHSGTPPAAPQARAEPETDRGGRSGSPARAPSRRARRTRSARSAGSGPPRRSRPRQWSAASPAAGTGDASRGPTAARRRAHRPSRKPRWRARRRRTSRRPRPASGPGAGRSKMCLHRLDERRARRRP